MKKLIKICAVAGLIGVSAAGALAQQGLGLGDAYGQDGRSQAAQAAVKDMAREMTECAVYFDIVAAVLARSNERDTSKKYAEAHKLAVARADSLMPGVVKDNYNALVKEMTNKVAMANLPKWVQDDLSNVSMMEIAVLQNQYGKLCKEVLNDPGERAKYWMKQVGAPPQ